MMRLLVVLLAGLTLGACVIQGPSQQQPAKTSGKPLPPPPPVALFSKIEIGMPRPEVERILGAPNTAAVLPGGVHEAWYLPAPPPAKPRLPKAPGAICVRYRDGRVVEKRFNAQQP